MLYAMGRWSEKLIERGEPQVHYVMDIAHEGYNNSDDEMIFLMLDIKKSTEVKL